MDQTDTAAEPLTGRRKYKRRTDEERIADLESRIAELRAKQNAKQKKDNPVLKEIPKVQRRLRKFAQLAMDHNRPDIANSITAFNAGLEGILRAELKPSRRVPELPEE
jgi:hypothetical protein